MFLRETGKPNLISLPNATSTVYYNGGLIYPNPSGTNFIPADSTSGNHIGICQEDITSSDARYTTAGLVSVDMLAPGDLVRATNVAGTLTAAKVGTYVDLTDSLVVNSAATSKLVVMLVKYISATEGIFMVNALASVKDVATT